MTMATEYRALAADAANRAEQASTPFMKTLFLDWQTAYLRLAEQAEQDALRDAPVSTTDKPKAQTQGHVR